MPSAPFEIARLLLLSPSTIIPSRLRLYLPHGLMRRLSPFVNLSSNEHPEIPPRPSSKCPLTNPGEREDFLHCRRQSYAAVGHSTTVRFQLTLNTIAPTRHLSLIVTAMSASTTERTRPGMLWNRNHSKKISSLRLSSAPPELASP